MKRRFFGIHLIWILVLILAACAAPTPTPAPTKAPVPTAAAKVGEPTKAPAAVAAAPTVPPGQKELILLSLGGSWEKAFKEAIIPPFEKKYGVKVNVVIGKGGSDIAAKVIAEKDKPEVDVFISADGATLKAKKAGALAGLDPARVTNYDDIYDVFKDPDRVMAPQGANAIGIAYNTKIFKEKGFAPPTSWYDLWRPELKSKVSISNIQLATTYGWLPLLARMETGNPRNVDAAFAKVKTLVPNLFTFDASSGQTDQALTSETVWIASHTSQRTYALQAQGVPVDFVYPKEGVPYLTNMYGVTKGAPHPELAQEFVNFLLGQEAQTAFAKAGPVGPSNKKVTLTPDVAKYVVYGLDQVKKLFPSDYDWVVSNLSVWTERWDKEIEAK